MVVVKIKSAEEYNQVKKDNPKVIVDFFATWCGPCKMIGPKLEELSEIYPDIKFIKVDVDELSAVSEAEQVNAMPTFKFFRNGEADKSLEVVGASEAKIKQNLDILNS